MGCYFQPLFWRHLWKHYVLVCSVGRMRCLAALARWEELNNLCKEYWTPAEPAARLEMAPMVVSNVCADAILILAHAYC